MGCCRSNWHFSHFHFNFKYTKTGKNDVIGYSSKCKKCGEETNGLKCPKCESVKKDWR